MRRPRRSEDYREYKIVKKFSDSEIRFTETSGLDIAFIFPNSYSVAVSSLAFSWVRDLLNSQGLSVERFFYDKSFKKFYSLESLRPLDEYNVWLFSLQFETDILNIARILKIKGIPVFAKDRNSNHPKVIIGGPVTYFNYKAPLQIADYVYRGDLEAYTGDFSRFLKGEDVKISALCSQEKKECNLAKVKDLNLTPPVGSIISPYGEFKNKLLIEIGRGCIRRCAFCMTGYIQKPARFLKPDVLKKILSKIPKDISLGIISATITDYPWQDELINILQDRKVSFSSMRMDGITEEHLKLLIKSGQRSFTVAPEGGSQKIRDILQKDITDEHIERALQLGIKVGIKKIKMYFIYGIEEETERDLEDIVKLSSKAKKIGYEVKVSLNPLIPKPGTPFEGRKMEDVKILREKEKFLKYLLKNHGIDFHFESIKKSILQYKIANASEDDIVEIINKMISS
ncbi:MAG: radical SAM protein [Thermotogaceae bacterium]|nr:radical SAM protein [Thermotogaceae bacterium]